MARLQCSAIKPKQAVAHEMLAASLRFCASSAIRLPLLALLAAPVVVLAQTITNINPPSNLLAPGSTSVALTFNTGTATVCAYSVGTSLPYGSMQSFDSGQPTTSHSGTVLGLLADPATVNHVYIRCASNPNDEVALLYRAVAAPRGAFPRIGTIWWGGSWMQSSQASRLQLYLAPGEVDPAKVLDLRATNPTVLVLTGLNATSTVSGGTGLLAPMVPDAYFLTDVNGNRIANWPGDPCSCLLNLTKPEVGEFIANYAYQMLVQSGLAFDGVFFDNFTTSISYYKTDVNGRSIQIDADGDGKPDDPAALDAAWQTGVYHLVETFRKLVPHGYASGHLDVPPKPATLANFNGHSFVGSVADVREGKLAFVDLFQPYQQWFTQGVPPVITMVQSQPPNQIAYGYGYTPVQAMPAATAEFGRTFYPNMRFGLALALMNDGFFAHDFGDNSSAVTWWYDEYDFDLGFPLGPASLVGASGPSANLLQNGGFESGLQNWQLGVFNDGSARATVAVDQTTTGEGSSSAVVNVATAGTVNWHIEFEQSAIALMSGQTYQLQFWARSDSAHTIAVHSQGGPPNFPNYGLFHEFQVDGSWKLYSVSFMAPVNATDGRIQFWFGEGGTFWIDGVALTVARPQVYRRDFSKGVVLLNGTSSPQTIALESGLRHFQGSQAPRYQYIVDDMDAAFSAVGGWSTACSTTPVTGTALNGPYYHAWNGTCHELDSGPGTAQWNLSIPADGQYTIQVWLPAAPAASGWTKDAIYDVVSGGSVLSSYTLDQSTATAGDQWHTIATVDLTVGGAPAFRVRNGGAGPLIADAVYVTSSALYNDGSQAAQIALGAFDGILLKRDAPVSNTAPAVEYFYSDWGYYFETAFPDEIALLDGGAFGGVWKRTGETFNVWSSANNALGVPTCRFFSTAFAPKSSHFYTPFADECTGLKANPNWQFESIAFYIALANANGVCPPGTVTLYRLYNNGNGGAPNHRYTTSVAVLNQMLSQGWVFEGNGNTKAFACTPG